MAIMTRNTFIFLLLVSYLMSLCWSLDLENSKHETIKSQIECEDSLCEEITIRFEAFGEVFALYLSLKKDLFSPNYFEGTQDSVQRSFPTNGEVGGCRYFSGTGDFWAAVSVCDQRKVNGVFRNERKEVFHLHFNEKMGENQIFRGIDLPIEPIGRSICTVEGSEKYMPREPEVYETSSGTKSRAQTKHHLELLIVNDNAFYKDSGSNSNLVHRFDLDLANLMSLAYNEFGISVVVKGIIVWKAKDEIEVSTDSNKLLENFQDYASSKLYFMYKYDSCHLLSGVDFRGDQGTVGRAYSGRLCTSWAVAINFRIPNTLVTVFGNIVTHELGHNLGLNHDDSTNCSCATNCFMAAKGSHTQTTEWSSCSKHFMKSTPAQKRFDRCLNNIPCPERCYGNGKCEQNGVCTCYRGYQPPNCKDMTCPGNCNPPNGVCNPLTGVCKCNKDFKGDDCSHKKCPNDCTEHGTCAKNGVCTCFPGYQLPDCKVRTCPGTCNGHGKCTNGVCVCDQGYLLPDCKTKRCQTGNCNPPNGVCDLLTGVCKCNKDFKGDDCSHKKCPNDCTGHGTCAKNGVCTCLPGYQPPDCSVKACPGNCNGHGKCTNGVCTCDQGYLLPDCKTKSCLGNCNGHGTCTNGICTCDQGYLLPDCRNKMCPANCNPPKGICDPITGVCNCNKGFDGADCSHKKCPNDCNGNGKCGKNGVCTCLPGYQPPTCRDKTCPEDCNGQGTCTNGQCTCIDGFLPPSCAAKGTSQPTSTSVGSKESIRPKTSSQRQKIEADGSSLWLIIGVIAWLILLAVLVTYGFVYYVSRRTSSNDSEPTTPGDAPESTREEETAL